MKINSIITAAICITTFLVSANAYAARQYASLKPSGKWNVNYADDSFRLARVFGEGDDKAVLFIDRFSPGDDFGFTISGKKMKMPNSPGKIKIRFGPSEAEQMADAYAGDLAKGMPSMIVRSTMRIAPFTKEEIKAQKEMLDVASPYVSITPEREAAVTNILLSGALNNPVILETGSIKKAMAALSACTDNLLTHWGIDVKRHATLSKLLTPVSLPSKWLNSNDYPIELLMKG